jgi:hypothetical protein
MAEGGAGMGPSRPAPWHVPRRGEAGTAAPWIGHNLAQHERIRRKIYNRHALLENLGLALHGVERIELPDGESVDAGLPAAVRGRARSELVEAKAQAEELRRRVLARRRSGPRLSPIDTGVCTCT